MHLVNKIALATVVVGAGFLAGCNSSSSSSDSGPVAAPYARVADLAPQIATISFCRSRYRASGNYYWPAPQT